MPAEDEELDEEVLDEVEAVEPRPRADESRAAEAEPRPRPSPRPTTEADAEPEQKPSNESVTLRAPAGCGAILAAVSDAPARSSFRFDRRLGARFVAGADEAGRGPLAGPLRRRRRPARLRALRDHRVRPLALLNDSKQCSEAEREELFRAVVGCAERVVVRAVPSAEIDREGLHRSNLAGLRAVLCRALAAGRGLPRRRLPARADRAGAPRGRRRRREERRDRRRVDRRQGDPRPDDAADGRALSRTTASARTSATSRRATPRSCASAGPLRSTAARSRRSATKTSSRLAPRPPGRRAERRALVALPAARLSRPRRRTSGSAATSSTSSSGAAGGSCSAR